jgi:hypothetical protein
MNPADLAKLLERRSQLEGILSRFEIWLLVFGALVVIGVAGESFFGIRTWWNNRKLQEVSGQIDQYRQSQIAEALKQAAEANLARTKIEQQLADRTITSQQREKLLTILRERRGRHVRVDSLLSEGREALAYALKLAAIFHDAGWDVVQPQGRAGFDSPLSGVLIDIRSDDAVSKELGGFIARALGSVSIPVSRYEERTIPAETVLVLVGGKQDLVVPDR